MGAKRLQIFEEAVPQMKRLVALWNVDSPGMRSYLAPMQEWERRTGVQLHVVQANTETDVVTALGRIAVLRADAMLVVPTAPIASQHIAVLNFAVDRRIPTMGTVTWWTHAGGLLSYAVADRDLDRRAATYVDRILKGAKPGDMPMEQPTQFELVINIKTAKALGLTIPPSLLLRADHVIE
jgi:putative tryptophan/tyrosine transport system substrate-binding protein